jgi:hypothetical protein
MAFAVRPATRGTIRASTDALQIRDTDGIAAIARHNDGSMGKFSYSR